MIQLAADLMASDVELSLSDISSVARYLGLSGAKLSHLAATAMSQRHAHAHVLGTVCNTLTSKSIPDVEKVESSFEQLK